jgi:hypothetical protein
MLSIRKILTRRSNDRGAMIAVYSSLSCLFLFDSKSKSGSHGSMAAYIAAILLIVLASVVAHFVSCKRRTAA